MKVRARTSAILLWCGAIFLGVQIWIGFAYTSYPINMPAAEFRTQIFIGDIGWTIFYTGGFFIVGAIIWILGDIRDRLAPPP